MKKLKYILLFSLCLGVTACSNWLEIKPQNAQTSDEYWNSKEEVEQVLAAGYVKLRACVPNLIAWGELRGGALYAIQGKHSSLSTFRITADKEDICKWKCLYEVINMANSVLKYGPGVLEADETFNENLMKSYLAEAYFLRALSYFYLVRNWKEVPLILTPYVNDDTEYDIAKSSDTLILNQIKTDVHTALNSGAAKTSFNTMWETKGRATQWALYALMADVCLWTEDYVEAEKYCDSLLNGEGNFRPVFIEDDSKWFEIFYPGNSNESIFEIQWDQTNYNQKNEWGKLFNYASPTYLLLPVMYHQLLEEYRNNDPMNPRGKYGTFVNTAEAGEDEEMVNGYIWKYTGTGDQALDVVRTYDDAHYIIYRVADLLLMKAEAIVMQGKERYGEALELVNKIRRRSLSKEYDASDTDGMTEEEMLEIIFDERTYELTGEGKRWYDVLRFGKRNNFQYKQRFIIDEVTAPWAGSTKAWIKSALSDNDALYLPIWQTELNLNKLLIQNPYYEK